MDNAFIEYQANGDGHDHTCTGCGGGIAENAPLYYVSLVADHLIGDWHPTCWEDRVW